MVRNSTPIMMQFTVFKQDLNEAVSNVQRAVSTKASIPTLEGILLEAKENELVLSAYNLSIGMRTTIPANVTGTGRTVVSARLFADIVRRMPGDTVNINVDDKNIAAITCGVSEFSIICMPGNEFPEFPVVGDYEEVSMPANVLKSMVRQTLYAVSEDEAKPVHRGSLFNIYDGQVDVVSLDGYRLAMRTEPIAFDDVSNFVIPGHTLAELLRLLKDDDDSPVVMHVGSRSIRIQSGSYQLFSALYEGEFLDYKGSIPQNNPTCVTVKTSDLIGAVERVSLLISEKTKSPIRCVFADGKIRLSCVTTVGKANDVISAKIEGPDVEIGFNNRYLLDALNSADCDEVLLKLGSSLTPMVVTPKEGNASLALVLPVRIRSEF